MILTVVVVVVWLADVYDDVNEGDDAPTTTTTAIVMMVLILVLMTGLLFLSLLLTLLLPLMLLLLSKNLATACLGRYVTVQQARPSIHNIVPILQESRIVPQHAPI